MGLNDTAWENLFEKYRILDEIRQKGYFLISAGQIREFREPRLMTKFDHKVNLPAAFSQNGLSILPVTRGDYVISSFSAYKEFEPPSGQVQRISVPLYLQSLSPQFLVSEAIALNCAYACGILQDFLEDDFILPTVSGRMSSGQFDFFVDTALGSRQVSVSNSQIEIDAAYEGTRFLSLFEAKRDLSDDFLIRQLYYPYRAWADRVMKPVKTIFLTFSDGVFQLYQYQFDHPLNYNSLRLVKQKNYVIAAGICLEDIARLLPGLPLIPEPEISFPQADSMPRIINLIELLAETPLTKQDITSQYAFDERQTNYYTDAGRYLGFLQKWKDEYNNVWFHLSPDGSCIMNLPYRERLIQIASRILMHKVFREVFILYLNYRQMPDTKTIVPIMRRSGLYRVESESTFIRRASTVKGWVNWILGITER